MGASFTMTGKCACGAAKDRRSALCRDCWLNRDRRAHEKQCCGCSTFFPIEEFALRPNGRGGMKRRSQCRACEAGAASVRRAKFPGASIAAKSKWARSNPERHLRGIMRKCARNLGLDEGEILRLFDAHSGLCDICGRPPSARGARKGRFTQSRLSIDHDHVTGKFRGFLCPPCNTGLGKLGDSIDGLKKAINYLEKSA